MMTPQLQDEINAALSAGAINVQELRDLVSRGYARMKRGIIERAVDAGITEAEIDAAIAKRR